MTSPQPQKTNEREIVQLNKVLYIPKDTMCLAEAEIRKRSATTVVKRQLGRDALTLLETLLVPNTYKCAVVIQCAVWPNSSWEWHQNQLGKAVQECNQVVFIDSRLPSMELLFLAQQGVILGHSTQDSASHSFVQRVGIEQVDTCTCRLSGCPGSARLLDYRKAATGESFQVAPLTECLLSGPEFNEDAQLIKCLTPSRRISGHLITQAIHQSWLFYANNKPLHDQPTENLSTEIIDRSYVFEVAKKSKHTTNLCAIDFRMGLLQFPEEIFRNIWQTSRSSILEVLVLKTLRERGTNPAVHPSTKCNCLTEYYIQHMCERQVKIQALAVPTAPIYSRLGDSVFSINSPAMRQLVTKQAVLAITDERIPIGTNAEPGSILHYDSVLHTQKRVRDFAKKKFGNFSSRKTLQPGRIRFRSVHFKTPDFDKANSWLLSHEKSLTRVHEYFGVEANRFKTLGSLAIHLGYMTNSERGTKNRSWLPAIAQKCTSVVNPICTEDRVTPFSVTCELDILSEMYHTANRNLLMARLSCCFLASCNPNTHTRSAFIIASALAIVSMLDDTMQPKCLPNSLQTLEMYMQKETGIDFFDLSHWFNKQ